MLNLRCFKTLLLLVMMQTAFVVQARQTPLVCSYDTYSWNVKLKRAVDRKTVRHNYSQLAQEEIDPVTGCTLCKEDQVWIEIAGVPPFQICHQLAEKIHYALSSAISQGATITTIESYRVGKTRGEVDHNGNRTGYSNHSYGIALDINSEQNGLYTNCHQFGSHCRLIRGGHWLPEQSGSLISNGAVVNAFKDVGYLWGGEIQGRQKDFMHFSPTGY